MPTQEARSQETQARLIRAARKRFVASGYHASVLDTILRDAGLSKGALYHHFPSKEALFAAVFEQVAAEAVDKARAADPGGEDRGSEDRGAFGPLARLIAISLAWLEAVREREARVIILENAPLVIGWQQTRAIQERTAIGLVRGNLRAAIAAGEAVCAHPQIAARLISVTLSELALVGHEAAEARLGGAEMRAIVEGLILHLAGAQPHVKLARTIAGASAKASA